MDNMVARNTRNSANQKSGALDLQRRADALGVSKSHLSRVLAGKRESRSLLLRLEKLMKGESAHLAKDAEKPN